MRGYSAQCHFQLGLQWGVPLALMHWIGLPPNLAIPPHRSYQWILFVADPVQAGRAENAPARDNLGIGCDTLHLRRRIRQPYRSTKLL